MVPHPQSSKFIQSVRQSINKPFLCICSTESIAICRIQVKETQAHFSSKCMGWFTLSSGPSPVPPQESNLPQLFSSFKTCSELFLLRSRTDLCSLFHPHPQTYICQTICNNASSYLCLLSKLSWRTGTVAGLFL